MKKVNVPTLTGRLLLVCFVFLLSMTRVSAQVDIVIGTGTATNSTTTYPCPIQDWYEGSRAQYLFRAQELIAAGMGPGNILAIRFQVTSVGTASIVEQHTYRVGTTPLTTLDLQSWVAGTTQVYGPVNYQPVVGINTFNFNSPFFWNGTDNIIIEACGGDPNSTGGITYTENPLVTWTTGLAFNGSHTYRNDNENNLCGTANVFNTGDATTRPNIIFSWVSATNCSGVPNPGTAASSKAIVCLNESFDLSLSGQTLASGLTYQWQSSSDGVNFTDITGATTTFYTTSQAATTYYRCIVTCTNAGGGSAITNVVQVSSPGLVSGTFTINNLLPTGGTNFNSFNAAYEYIKCGINGPVIFNVVTGTGPYTEQLVMNPVPGSSATNTITFNGNGATIEYLSTNGAERATIKLNGTDYTTFNDLVIKALGSATTDFGFGVQLLSSADSNTINGCTIQINQTSTSTNFAGIVISNSATSATATGATLCDFNTFTNNTVTGGYYGITMVGSATDANGNNTFINNNVSEYYQYGMYVLGSFNALIERNSFSRPARLNNTTFYGIYFTGLSVGAQINRNKIFNPYGANPTATTAAYGVYFTGNDGFPGFENKVTNNLIYNFTGSGDVYGIYNAGSDNAHYYHNTILLDGSATNTVSTNLTRGFYQTTTAAGIDFRNNIVAITREGISTKHAMYFNTNTSTIISNNNDFYLNPASGTPVSVGFFNANQATLAAWQAATVQDANSITSNPGFSSIIAYDLRPTNASVNDLGAPVGVAVDHDGNARSATTPDMGAYEFAPGNCTTPPNAGNALASPTTVCQGATITLGLTNNSTGLGQTYQWQTSASPSGPYTAIGSPRTNPDTAIIAPGASFYVSVAVTCGTSTVVSTSSLVTVNPSLLAGTYTINQTQPTGGTNYNNFAAAKAALECGILGPVVFEVVAGTGPYNEQLVLDSIRGASAVNTVTFNGNGNMITFAPVINEERAVIKLRRADHITFNNLIIDATAPGFVYGFGVHILIDADSNTVNNCTIITDTASGFSASFAGVVINSSATNPTTTGNSLCDGNRITGNTIIGGTYGVVIVGSNTSAVQSTTVSNNTIQDFQGYGIYVLGTFDALIEANDISRPTRSNVSTFYGVYFTGLSVAAKITRNRIHEPYRSAPNATAAAFGIYITANDAFPGFETKVTNNLVYDMVGQGEVTGLYNGGSDNCHFYHNTISLDDESNTSTGVTRGFYQTTLATAVEFRNNIVTIRRGASGAKHAIYLNTANSGVVSNYNDFFIDGAAGVNAIGFFNGANRITLADWQGVSAQDANSWTYNPEYSNPGVGNYTPLMTAMDNLGTPVGVAVDILNASRSATTPDLGAYEFVIPVCTAPPVAGVSTAVPSSAICVGDRIRLDLSNNSIGSGQTYQWQMSPDGVNWTNIGPLQFIARYDHFMTTDTYFRCQVTCSTSTVSSTPVQVTLNPPLASGFYTINPALPAVLPNFQSFTAVANILECGIAGFVTFDAAPGVYNEQIRLRRIGGAGPNARVTFRSASGDPTSVTLTYASTSTTRNYTLALDSASYVTFANMTIQATDAVNGRAIEMANTASFDSITNCIINTPVVTATNVNNAGLVGRTMFGRKNVISKNTFNNGAYGILFEGNNAGDLSRDHVIDSNTVNTPYHYGIFTNFTSRLKLTRNTVNLTAPNNNNVYGIYAKDSDTGYVINGNSAYLSGIANTAYGIYVTGCNAIGVERGSVESNTVIADDSNTGNVYGLYVTASSFGNVNNNVISVNTSGASQVCAGLYSQGSSQTRYYNNSINNLSSSTNATNTAAYFAHTSAANGRVDIRNNIFSHGGTGVAAYYTNVNFLYSDYNMFFSGGTNLIRQSTTVAYATLDAWINGVFWDIHSISYRPAFAGPYDLTPDLANPNVWAMHGRGEQIPENDHDFFGNSRPTTITTGVPDLGAYEFLPTALPTVLTAANAPVAGGSQVFMYGTDTVAIINYNAGSVVPTSVTAQRYSGVIPPGLAAGQQSMYFYTDFTLTGAQPSSYSIKKFYYDPWQGFIPRQQFIKLGQTDNTGAWVVKPNSQVNDVLDFITDTSLNYMAKFTGLADSSSIPPPGPVVLPTPDSSNRGTRFWVAYAHHYGFEFGNDQDMRLYFSAEQDANVTVKVNGTPYVREYFVPAGSVLASQTLPKQGLFDARILVDGKSPRGISIESDVPIVAYAHIYAPTTSEAAMLLPVGTYSYEYTTLTTEQEYVPQTYSWTYVIADQDSTVVEITPSQPTLSGRPARVPFVVTLNRGEVYQVLGAIISGSIGYDLTGTKIRSIANSSGRCMPMAVFSGSSRTYIECAGGFAGGGDNIMEQNFPYVAWGKRYLTAPTSNSSAANSFHTNIYRVAVKDTSTVVTRNGVQLTNLIDGFYYEFESNTADLIVGDKPIIVAQIMSSSGGCANTGGVGDPAMIYVSPVEQGIKRVGLYRNTQSAITHQYVTLIVRNTGLASLTIDGSNVFDHTYPHTNDPNYTVVVKRWNPAAAAQVIVNCDSAFTAITYGLGSVESYGYNAGTLIKNLNAIPALVNTLGGGGTANYTCVNAPFQLNIRISLSPTRMEWQLSQVPGISPNTDVILVNPTPQDSVVINGTTFYDYSLPGTFTFTEPGNVNIPIRITHPDIEGCNSTLDVSLPVNVLPAPVVDFNDPLFGCTGQAMSFNGIANTNNNSTVVAWGWDFSDPPVDTIQNTTHTFNAPGTYNVSVAIISADGCLSDTTKVVTINDKPVVEVIPDTISTCTGRDVTFNVNNPVTGVTYNWYSTQTGGTPVGTGTSYTLTNVTAATVIYVEGVTGVCVSDARTAAVVTIDGPLATPVVVVDSAGADFVAFSWNAVPRAVGYEVSTDNGTTWNAPTSGTLGLNHTVNGLQPNDSVTLIVRALAQDSCQNSVSAPVTGKTYSNQDIFIPNAFTPNGDGNNDVLQVFPPGLKSIRFMVFNQWGQKISESSNQNNVWDGKQNGKLQPSGVYMYVAEIFKRDGTRVIKKGSINLIR